jgi:hypothetical protein
MTRLMSPLLTWLALIAIGSTAIAATPTVSDNIRVSSIGYPSNRAKVASVVGQDTGAFSVIAEDGSEVMTGELGKASPFSRRRHTPLFETNPH